MVAERLKTIDAEVLAYDPFMTREKAECLGLSLVSLEEIFKRCDIISNHLANKEELRGIFNAELFRLMKPQAVFINTGRGAQVKEGDLALALLKNPGRVALLDVLQNERAPFFSPLWWCPNAYFTPHCAGSLGNECHRMADCVIDDFRRYISGEPLLHEVTLEKLERMA
jgi:phosphoglycerate dehydrogenase-like enzyme